MGRSSSILAWIIVLLLAAPVAEAKHPIQRRNKNVPCAILTHFSGEIQILDPSRTKTIDSRLKAGIPCGGWVSVKDGWAELTHKQGYRFKIGSGTFVEVFDNIDGKQISGTDHLVLYRGKVVIYGEKTAGPLNVLTANARIRQKEGSALVTYNHLEEETQVVALEMGSSIENRFEGSRKISMRGGEASALNFKLLRIVPSAAQGVKLASLKEKLNGFHFTDKDYRKALKAAFDRSQKRFANKGYPKRKKDRSIASKHNYKRHQAQSDDGTAHSKWVQNMVGGVQDGEKILFPEKFYGRTQRAKVQVEDPGARFIKKRRRQEQLEKDRLIDELSKIKSYY